MRVPMIATKDMRYGTRMLRAADEFEAYDRGQARLLTALGRARLVEVGETKKEVRAEVEADARAALRAEYQRVVGKKPYNGWNADTLREKIAAAVRD